MEELKFLYTTDKKYFPHMLTSIYSLLENNKNHNIEIYIIEDGFQMNEFEYLLKLEKLYKNLEIKVYLAEDLKTIMEEYNIPKWRDTTIANARLFASELINYDKILYLDSDTIIAQPLDELFSMPMQHPIAAAKNLTVPLHTRKKLSVYYNSGVIMFDSAAWKKEKCLEKLKQTIDTNKIKLLYPDQDLINLAFKDQIDTLTTDYNLHPIYYQYLDHNILLQKFFRRKEVLFDYNEIKQAIENPHIYHSLCYLQLRPWEENQIHPFNKIYEKYRKMWDPTFKPEDNEKMISNYLFVSYLNLLSKAYLPENIHKILSNKVKKIKK